MVSNLESDGPRVECLWSDIIYLLTYLLHGAESFLGS